MSRRRDESESQEPEWVTITLDPVVAQRQGMPDQIPIRKDYMEVVADEGLNPERLSGWIEDFLTNSAAGQSATWRRRNSGLVGRLEAYVQKVPLLKKANDAFALRDFETATKLIKKVTILDPEDASAKLNLASAYANQREYDKALKQLKQIRQTYADDPDYHVTVAQVHVAQHNGELAIESLVKALEAKPDHRGAMDALAKLGVLTSVYEDPRDAASLVYVKTEAVADYLAERWESEPRGRDYYLQQLAYHEREGRPHVALLAAERAIAMDEELCEPAELARVSCLRALGRLDEALRAAQALVDKAPKLAGGYVELGRCLLAAGDEAKARELGEQALGLDPGDQNALVFRFWPDDRASLPKVAEALPALQAFVDAHADNPGALRNLARAKLVVGSEKEALELFEKAVALAPDDDDLRGEWWQELAKQTEYQRIIDDAEKLGGMKGRHWSLRWNEAEAYRGLGKLVESRGCYLALNHDSELHVDLRKRAKRAAEELGSPAQGAGPAQPSEGG